MTVNTYTPNTIIQSSQVNADLAGLANGTNDTTNNSMSTYRSEEVFDHVASGCVWSGDSYAVNRNASQTSGVVYISGVRLTVAAVSARTFTASKDTYIDVNGSGVQVYTEVTNNAASPALAAGSIRIGIIITGATTIAAATSVNQGQETMILPIASSIAYSVTDSLGNLICSRDSLRRILGYRQIIANPANFSSVTAVVLTGLAAPVIVPTNRKIKITVFVPFLQAGGALVCGVSIWDGTVGSGTKLNEADYTLASSGYASYNIPAPTTPTSASKTYSAGVAVSTNAVTVNAATTNPAYIIVELV